MKATKKGQKFYSKWGTEILTVKSFFGSSGIEYDTYSEAVENNVNSKIVIKNSEYGGASWQSESVVIEKIIFSWEFL